MNELMRSNSSLMDLSDRTALITGGAGHLGRAMAISLAEQGAKIILLDASEAALESAKEILMKDYAVSVECIKVDLESSEQIADVPALIAEYGGTLDILVNNAAFSGTSKLTGWGVPFEQQSVETWRRALEVNLTAVFAMAKVCKPLLRRSAGGSIINVASIYGVLGPDMSLYDGTEMGNPAAYAASKGGLIQLTRWLATVLSPDVRVNCISPGGLERGQPLVFQERYIEKTPLRRMAVEEDFKGVALFLASDMSRYITGQNILVDGGWSTW